MLVCNGGGHGGGAIYENIFLSKNRSGKIGISVPPELFSTILLFIADFSFFAQQSQTVLRHSKPLSKRGMV